MSNHIAKTNAATSQSPSWLGRIGQAFREAFGSHDLPAPKSQSGDHFIRGTTLSEGLKRRLAAQNAGRSANGREVNAHPPSRDAHLVAYLNHIVDTGDPTPPDHSPTRIA
ncbi:MAG TPA: hypothetical protein VLJ37_06190 [bacterium]|nr:hypothetical protein [bacterium]